MGFYLRRRRKKNHRHPGQTGSQSDFASVTHPICSFKLLILQECPVNEKERLYVSALWKQKLSDPQDVIFCI